MHKNVCVCVCVWGCVGCVCVVVCVCVCGCVVCVVWGGVCVCVCVCVWVTCSRRRSSLFMSASELLHWKDSVCWVFAALSQKGFRQNPDVLPTDASCDKAEVGKDEHDIESLV